MPRRPPGARERSLGAELRAIREQTGDSVTAVAARLGWTKSTLSRLETGQRAIAADEVATLCGVYGITDPRREDLISRTRAEDDEPGWWERGIPGVPRESTTLASYEAEARRITSFGLTLVPGLLQTSAYARAYMLADGIAPGDVETRVMARRHRQEVLAAARYTAIISECALRTAWGGPAVMAAQLDEIARRAAAPTVEVLIVPAHLPHPDLVSAFVLLEFLAGAPVAHIELAGSAVWLEREAAAVYARAADRLRVVALDETESVRLVERIAEEYRANGKSEGVVAQSAP